MPSAACRSRLPCSRHIGRFPAVLLAMLMVVDASAATFVYEGRLDDGAAPANGRYDFNLSVFDAEHGGTSIHSPITYHDVGVAEGRFRLELDAPLASGSATWVEVAVRSADSAGFVSIPGRSKAMASALIGQCWSTTGDTGSDPASNFLGTIDSQPLVLRAGNVRGLSIEPSSVVGGTPARPITSNVIAGSHANRIVAGVRGGTIAGGGADGDNDPKFPTFGVNTVSDHYSVVGGGLENTAGSNNGVVEDGSFATVAGGFRNHAAKTRSTVGGGWANTANGDYSVVSGGVNNATAGVSSTIAGGESNITTSAAYSGVVSGGAVNVSAGRYATVPGGLRNCAGGEHSLAGGRRAKVRPGNQSSLPAHSNACTGVEIVGDADGDEGTLVWADARDVDFVSDGPNRYLVRAEYGVRFQSPTTASSAGDVGYFNVVRGPSGISSGRILNTVASFESNDNAFIRVLAPDNRERGIAFGDPGNVGDGGIVYNASNALQFRTNGNITRMTLDASGALALNVLGSAGTISLCRNASLQIASCSSSARYKDEIDDLELGLDAVLKLRPVRYRWKDSGMADIGFVAEEVAVLDERLVTRDASGAIEGVKYDRLSAVLAGAVQSLVAQGDVMAGDIDRLTAENAALRDRQQAQDWRLDALAAELVALRSGRVADQ